MVSVICKTEPICCDVSPADSSTFCGWKSNQLSSRVQAHRRTGQGLQCMEDQVSPGWDTKSVRDERPNHRVSSSEDIKVIACQSLLLPEAALLQVILWEGGIPSCLRLAFQLVLIPSSDPEMVEHRGTCAFTILRQCQTLHLQHASRCNCILQYLQRCQCCKFLAHDMILVHLPCSNRLKLRHQPFPVPANPLLRWTGSCREVLGAGRVLTWAWD